MNTKTLDFQFTGNSFNVGEMKTPLKRHCPRITPEKFEKTALFLGQAYRSH